MSVRSRSSGSSSRRSGEYRELQIPGTFAVKSLIWFCGRDPRKVKSVRRYYDEDFDARSTGSGGSMFSWSSAAGQVCLVETTNPYWYWGEESESGSYSSSRRKSSKTGRSSRTSQRSNPRGTWAKRATVEDDDDDDDSSSEGSVEDYDGPGPGPAPYPHPSMMPHQGPPPGAFQPVYGMYPQHASPHPTPPNGYPVPPPPPPAAGGMPPPPPPPGGHFVTDPSGIQVFMS